MPDVQFVTGNPEEPILVVGDDPNQDGNSLVVRLPKPVSIPSDHATGVAGGSDQAKSDPADTHGTLPQDAAGYDPVTGLQTAGTDQSNAPDGATYDPGTGAQVDPNTGQPVGAQSPSSTASSGPVGQQ